MPKRPPNILVTGTPGTGKTSTCEQVAQATGLKHVNVGDLVKAQELHSGFDEEHQAYIIDEDKVSFRFTTWKMDSRAI
jgi:adenylate kinase